VVLCCALGGEPGRVLRGLIESEPLTLRAAATPTANGVYIHDRRSGNRVEVVRVDSEPLPRHAADELYGITLGAGLDADLTLITGCEPEDMIEADMYRRLAGDLRANGKVAIADLTGAPLPAALAAASSCSSSARRSSSGTATRPAARSPSSSMRHDGCTPPVPGTCSSREPPRPRC
jgi:hypothetical protein